jgi:hypothetical protein
MSQPPRNYPNGHLNFTPPPYFSAVPTPSHHVGQGQGQYQHATNNTTSRTGTIMDLLREPMVRSVAGLLRCLLRFLLLFIRTFAQLC